MLVRHEKYQNAVNELVFPQSRNAHVEKNSVQHWHGDYLKVNDKDTNRSYTIPFTFTFLRPLPP